jgi:hypothetical protein
VVITHNVVSLRASPDRSAEQVSQAILGESALLLETYEEYALLRTEDAYEGWAYLPHLTIYTDGSPYPPDATISFVRKPFARFTAGPPVPTDIPHFPLVFGSRIASSDLPLHLTKETLTVLLPDGQYGYIESQAVMPETLRPQFSVPLLCELSLTFLGVPYLWGGTTPFGFDCSGFIQRLYSAFGVLLPRDAYQQADSPLGNRLPEGTARQAGDLVFFQGDHDPRGRGITHVGMALDNTRFIHASGKEGVTVTCFDDPYYARTYRCAWRNFKRD